MSIKTRIRNRWARLWMRFSGPGPLGRAACGLAGLGWPPFYGRLPLAAMGKNGYISPCATLYHSNLGLNARIFIGDQALIYEDHGGGRIELGAGVHIHRDCLLQTGRDGRIVIGDETHIQPCCQLSAYVGAIHIGCRVEIAPNCAFYPYNHGLSSDRPLRQQPVQTKGGIVIGDDAWLGVGVIVLDGVTIGAGAVIGAGSVVSRDIPAMAIAVGNPATVVRIRAATP